MFKVTECQFHGTTEAPDLVSFARYVDVANECVTSPPHTHEAGVSCWVCCPSVKIDPNGVIDRIQQQAAFYVIATRN